VRAAAFEVFARREYEAVLVLDATARGARLAAARRAERAMKEDILVVRGRWGKEGVGVGMKFYNYFIIFTTSLAIDSFQFQLFGRYLKTEKIRTRFRHACFR